MTNLHNDTMLQQGKVFGPTSDMEYSQMNTTLVKQKIDLYQKYWNNLKLVVKTMI